MRKTRSKPIVPVTFWTLDGRSTKARALFDTGTQDTIVRQDALPEGAQIIRFAKPREFGTAGPLPLKAVGMIPLELAIGKKWIRVLAYVVRRFPRPLVIGSDAMQYWCVTVLNTGDKTRVLVGLDLRDPELMEVI